MKKYIIYLVCIIVGIISCDDFLDKEPLSEFTPEQYLNEETQLAAYTIARYPDILLTHTTYSSISKVSGYGIFGQDMNTDNMTVVAAKPDTRFIPGQWRTAESGGSWNFEFIYPCNYFLQDVLPKWRAGKITGNAENINHYIGEMYFLRAYVYFSKLQVLGDFPILKRTYPDEQEVLTSISQRYPRNEVARFILSDLDSAILLMKNVSPDGGKNRLSKNCAYLFKSRVALYEGTWLKYFKGTAFVPGSPDWPGKNKVYNANFSFPSGNIDAEINFFLEAAMQAAKAVADNVELVKNTQQLQQSSTEQSNPYFNMFSDVDMSGYSEVLLWRQYDKGLGIMHSVPWCAQGGNLGIGTSRGMVESFLMANGLPIYVSGSGYAGDDYISDVRSGRDNRLWLFLKDPGQVNVFSTPNIKEPYPVIYSNNVIDAYQTGYALRKGGNFNEEQNKRDQCYTGCVVFRAAEAYLNYMEACYERYENLDADAQKHWKAIRTRGGVDPDYQKTINNTDLSKEAPNDWGVYSGGNMVDATLYNIRRERRCELMAEAFRYMDVRRWRSLDQLISTPYHIEGFKLWGPMQNWYIDEEGNTPLIYGGDNSKSNVSDPALGLYLRPNQVIKTSLIYNGYRWHMAHYLEPIDFENFLNTSTDNDVSTSPIYQNPYWPTAANQGPVN